MADIDARLHMLQKLLTLDELAVLARIGVLSFRERAIFVLVGRGMTAKQIAAELMLSTNSVETMMSRVRQKLGDAGHAIARADLVFLARMWSRVYDRETARP